VHEVQVHHVSVDFGLLGERIGARASCAGYDPKQTKETGRGDSMEAHSHRDKWIAARASGHRGAAALNLSGSYPDCGKALDLYRARSLTTLFTRRLFLRCLGWPRCEFYARYKPRGANDGW